jgi:hypothetical protein
MYAVALEIKKGSPDQWNPLGHNLFSDHHSISSDFPLCASIHSQIEKVQQIVQINFPLRLGVS